MLHGLSRLLALLTAAAVLSAVARCACGTPAPVHPAHACCATHPKPAEHAPADRQHCPHCTGVLSPGTVVKATADLSPPDAIPLATTADHMAGPAATRPVTASSSRSRPPDPRSLYHLGCALNA